MIRRGRTLRRRLTRTGQVFVVCALLALLASWNSGINLYYLVFGAIASFLFFSFVLSRRTLQKLDVTRENPHAATRDETFGVMVRIKNRRKNLPVASIRIEHADNPNVSVGYVLMIPADRTAQVRIIERFTRRGVHKLPALDLVTSFPFGLVEARRRIYDTAEIVVYPRVHAARTALLDQLRGSGELPKVAHGIGDEFFSLREYVPGDDLRFIAWRASARTGQLLVKELEQQTARFVIIIFDSRLRSDVENFYEHFEEAVELIASVAITLLNRQYRVAIVTPTLVLGEGEGSSQVLKVLEMLARVEPADPGADDPFWRATQMEDSHRVSLLMVSPDPAQWGEVRAGGNIRVLDPREVVHA